tara:strand:+ start:13156 stop:13683 length:528 start_codon:yes stop_codon:yes gene_type:complete
MATETMNLSDAGDGMVPLNFEPPANQMTPPGHVQNNAPEKNINKEHIKMDSTPLTDIMTSQEVMETQQPMMMAPPQSSMMAQQAMMMAPQQQAPAQAQTPLPSKNPFSLTDEQMQALVVAVCAAIAFSEPVQAKLGSTIPQFLAESGSRSMVGLLVSGLVAAIFFYFGQRFVMKA